MCNVMSTDYVPCPTSTPYDPSEILIMDLAYIHTHVWCVHVKSCMALYIVICMHGLYGTRQPWRS